MKAMKITKQQIISIERRISRELELPTRRASAKVHASAKDYKRRPKHPGREE